MFLGAYEVLLCVARGGMASVWAARQHGARGFVKRVALKAILPELRVPEFESMFLEEASLAARIRHPNVCEVFELIEEQGVLALTMEWIDGESLSKIIPKGSGALPVRTAARIVADAARGLHAAHELRDDSGAPMNVVHRDVSPQNILVTLDGQVKVADFGIAKAFGSTREVTAVGRVKGKLNYMSPEQAQGARLDRRSDVFSLGAVLYLASVGRYPFRDAGDTTEDQVSRLLTGKLVPPSALDPDYPVGLERIVMRAMSGEPSKRFASAAEMRTALEDWLAGSGPFVTEDDVAKAVVDRVGAAIEQREAKIQRYLEVTPVEIPRELPQDSPGSLASVATELKIPERPLDVAARFRSSMKRTGAIAILVTAAAVTLFGASLRMVRPEAPVHATANPVTPVVASEPARARESSPPEVSAHPPVVSVTQLAEEVVAPPAAVPPKAAAGTARSPARKGAVASPSSGTGAGRANKAGSRSRRVGPMEEEL